MDAAASHLLRHAVVADPPLYLRCGVVDNEFWAAAITLFRRTDCVVCRWLPHPSEGATWRGRRVSGGAVVTTQDRAILVPEPVDAWSFGVVAHEVGHQVLHRERRRVRVWERELEANEYALERFVEFDLPGANEFRRMAVEHVEDCFQRALDRGANIQTILARANDWVTERLYARHWQRQAEERLFISAGLLGIWMFPSDPPSGANLAALLGPYARGEVFPGERLMRQAQALATHYGVDLAQPSTSKSGRAR